nr:MAG TPA: hypothetical protein [Caudoviricetes sp.]
MYLLIKSKSVSIYRNFSIFYKHKRSFHLYKKDSHLKI